MKINLTKRDAYIIKEALLYSMSNCSDLGTCWDLKELCDKMDRIEEE